MNSSVGALVVFVAFLLSIVGQTAFSSGSLYNDYTEERYHQALDLFEQVMGPRVSDQGGRLVIQRDWSDGAVNAWAWIEGDLYLLEVPGGAARYHLLNEEAFAATLCHELGHLMGGAPGSEYGISYEGQADYYSAAKCLRIFLRELTPWKTLPVPEDVALACANAQWFNLEEKRICERSLLGALALTSYYAELERAVAPKLHTPSTERPKKTLVSHPSAQCRFDTYVAGALCPVSKDIELSEEDLSVGACHKKHFPEYARPRCWFADSSISQNVGELNLTAR